MRQGELLALTWRDIDLISGVVHVRRSYTRRAIDTPKSFTSKRYVHLPAELVSLLGRWWGECGQPDEGKLVFAGGGKDGYLAAEALTKSVLYPAMKRAGIGREGSHGREANLPLSAAHLRQDRASERPRPLVAQPPPRPLIDHGDDRYVRAL
jgi:integrase